ncbi:MAG: transporter substrate-binding domain-containing protein [Kiritimatiellae bacterium]|nr:transporter substrate-binding domain-containing protein [Kiritimatiellia bacterium]MDD4737583.1 transporter substrate-binding domain-containing protein [Kiritimatiellia bacterium]
MTLNCRLIRRMGTLLSTLLFAISCTGPGRTPKSGANTLRVGITPDYPPLVFIQGEQTVGLEVDFAHLLAGELGLPLQLVPLEWNALIPSLLEGKIDLIMSGMSITQGRKVRIAFSEPYAEVGQMALIRQADKAALGSIDQLTTAQVRIGVIRETTGDVFVQRYCPNAKRVVYSQPKDAVWDLGPQRKRIDAFLYDDPAIRWFASANEADLLAIEAPFTREHLAWGLRRNDEQLLNEVNRCLKTWKKDGQADRLIHRWIP